MSKERTYPSITYQTKERAESTVRSQEYTEITLFESIPLSSNQFGGRLLNPTTRNETCFRKNKEKIISIYVCLCILLLFGFIIYHVATHTKFVVKEDSDPD